ncbi:hypothetical protein WBJ53_27420 [Spirosoma sp. SC4-14]|uniref:hypothetical protein n=1 Tax=Spirosoma sp. SC4-14 TaxID=3128900 RepID=UPI0030D3B16B
MKPLSLLFALCIVLSACRKESASPLDDGTLTGRFRLEVDPIRCAMPTTQRLTIQSTGTDTYQFVYDRFGVGTYRRMGIKATKINDTKLELSLNGQAIGQYAYEELRSLTGTQKRWVLMVSHEANQSDGLEFMGVKE